MLGVGVSSKLWRVLLSLIGVICPWFGASDQAESSPFGALPSSTCSRHRLSRDYSQRLLAMPGRPELEYMYNIQISEEAARHARSRPYHTTTRSNHDVMRQSQSGENVCHMAHMYVCIYIYIYRNIIYIHTYIHTYVRIYTHTHTHTQIGVGTITPNSKTTPLPV